MKRSLKRPLEPPHKKKVVCAMSGGVDSSTVAAMLVQQGYEVIGMHLQFWSDRPSGSEAEKLTRPQGATFSNKCCTLEGLEDARHVARLLNIPFYVMNVVSSFKTRVVDYFLETYASGQTPNPCVECNKHIKFGELLDRARELGAEFLVSGHYARLARSDATGQQELFMASDKAKDQSYFLYHLSQDQLSSVLFPLGDLLKSQVYELAQKFGLTRVIEKPESQGLCFFAEGKPLYFLQRHLGKQLFKPGFIETVDGRKVGMHKGLPLYTIGQRQGLGIGGIAGEPEGESWYVVKLDSAHNRLIVGREKDILQSEIICSDLRFISHIFYSGAREIFVRIRHRGELIPAILEVAEGRGIIRCLKPARGVAPGQSAVFYEGEKVLGGGIIEEIKNPRAVRAGSLTYEKEAA